MLVGLAEQVLLPRRIDAQAGFRPVAVDRALGAASAAGQAVPGPQPVRPVAFVVRVQDQRALAVPAFEGFPMASRLCGAGRRRCCPMRQGRLVRS